MTPDAPIGLDHSRHRDLVGRSPAVWGRRLGVLVVATIPLLALFNVFGQRSAPARSSAPLVSLTVDSPARVRGGLMFTSEFIITPHEPLKDARLQLDNGWFRGMTFNGASPQPSNESAQGRWQIYDYGPLPAGVQFPIWISWQVNPTNVGWHAQTVVVADGNNTLLTAHRTITVFP